MVDAPETLVVDDEVCLVPCHFIDPAAFLEVVKGNIDELGEWLGWAAATYSNADVETFFEASRHEWSEGSAHGYVINYLDRPSGTIGLARLKSPARDFEIGYWLDRKARGRGIVTKACRALLNEAFEKLGANLVAIRAAPGNTKSRAVAVRTGMAEEGTLRMRSNNARGDLLDLVVYSITAAEWRAGRGG